MCDEVLMEKPDEESICSCDPGDVHTVFCCSKHIQTELLFNLYLFLLDCGSYLESLSVSSNIFTFIVPLEDTSTRWSKQYESKEILNMRQREWQGGIELHYKNKCVLQNDYHYILLWMNSQLSSETFYTHKKK